MHIRWIFIIQIIIIRRKCEIIENIVETLYILNKCTWDVRGVFFCIRDSKHNCFSICVSFDFKIKLMSMLLYSTKTQAKINFPKSCWISILSHLLNKQLESVLKVITFFF